jgi:hypothetical protein
MFSSKQAVIFIPPKVISTSQINLYRSCPRSYYLKYIVGLKSPIPSPQLEFGLKIHSLISSGKFVSEDIREQEMLTRAQNFLKTLPTGGISETSYEDKQNPARFYGDICGHRAVGVFDKFWEPEECIGIDWKSGPLHTSYVDQYEIQGYFLSELFRQRYSTPLKRISFKFLADDATYDAKILSDEKTYKKAERAIKNALSNIEKEKFEKKCSGRCDFCDMSPFCCMEI